MRRTSKERGCLSGWEGKVQRRQGQQRNGGGMGDGMMAERDRGKGICGRSWCEDGSMEKKNRWKTGLSGGLSLWALLAKGSFYKILAVAFFMAVTEAAAFRHTLQKSAALAFEINVEWSRIHLVFLAALGTAFFVLIRTNENLDNKGRYTVMRLRVTGAELFAIRTAYDMLCLLLLFGVQAGLVLWFAESYRRMPGALAGPQTVFLAFYRNEFLHGLLPMAERGKWVRNALMLLALGMEEAGGMGKRNRTTQVSVFVLSAAWFALPAGLTWQEVICDFVYAVVIAADLRDLYMSCRNGIRRAA